MIVEKTMREEMIEIVTKDAKLLLTIDGKIALDTKFDRFSLMRGEDELFRDWANYTYYIKT